MKNEKFCFNKGTGLIALLGIVLVAAVFFMNYTTSQQQPTSTKAALGCPTGSAPDVINKCPTELTVVGADGQPLTVKNPVTSTVYKCCYAPTTFSPKCPAGTAPDVINKCPTSLKSGIKTTFLATGTQFECCNYPTAWNPLGSGPVVATPVVNTPIPVATAVPPTPDPRTVTQSCAPDAKLFLPADFGCQVCASSTRLAQLKQQLFNSTPVYKTTFGTVDKMPNYYATGDASGKRACYQLFAKPAKSGAAGNICTSESCVMCNNLQVADSLCNGTKISCTPDKTQLAAINPAYTAAIASKNFTDVKAKINALFKAGSTQVSSADLAAGYGNCYMVNAAALGTPESAASYAFQTTGYCGMLKLKAEFQTICSCATMTNMDTQTCKTAMSQIATMAR